MLNPYIQHQVKLLFPFTTPVTNRTKINNLKDLKNFVQDHLNSLPADYKLDYTYLLKNKVPNITECGDDEDALYAPICSLLNLISNYFHSKHSFLVLIAL